MEWNGPKQKKHEKHGFEASKPNSEDSEFKTTILTSSITTSDVIPRKMTQKSFQGR
jgi:hypothetical protein